MIPPTHTPFYLQMKKMWLKSIQTTACFGHSEAVNSGLRPVPVYWASHSQIVVQLLSHLQ